MCWCTQQGQAAGSSKPCTAACAAWQSWGLLALLLAMGWGSGATCCSEWRVLLCCCWLRLALHGQAPAHPVLQGWLLLLRRQQRRLARCPGQRELSAGVAAQTRRCCCWARLALLLLLLLRYQGC